MKKLFLIGASLLALSGAAQADVILDTNGQGGTGTNVIFSSFNGPLGVVLGTLNGQHNEIVRFRDLSGNSNFVGSVAGGNNGNDIKINNTSDLDITVFNSTDTAQISTSRDIFSLKGDGYAFIRVTMLEADGTFKFFNFGRDADDNPLYKLGNGQSGFDFKAINGETIWDIDLFTRSCTGKVCVAGGMIEEFEHYRIDVAPNVGAVPEASTWAMMILGFFGIGGLAMAKRRREGGAAFRLV